MQNTLRKYFENVLSNQILNDGGELESEINLKVEVKQTIHIVYKFCFISAFNLS